MNKLFCILSLVFIIGCGSDSVVNNGGTGSAIARLQWDNTKSISDVHSATAPEGVVTVRIIVSGSDMSAIQKDFPASDGKGLIEGIPAGSSRTFTAQGLDASGVATYQGAKDGITIQAGQTTDVGTIVMLINDLSQLIGLGLDALNSRLVTEARNYFKAAVDMLNGDESQNDRDTARFFYALTKVWSRLEITSDGNSDDMNRLGDIMDKFGCDISDSTNVDLDAVCPDEGSLPNNSPTTNDLKSFGNDVIRPEIVDAISDLDSVSSSFNKLWAFDNENVESDFGDVLFVKSAMKGGLAYMDIEAAYHYAVDIDFELNDLSNTWQKFLNNNPAFLTLSDSSTLSSAKSLLSSSLDDMTSAINFINSEIDDQSDDLIEFDSIDENEVNQALADIADAKSSLNGPTIVDDNDTINPDNNEPFTLDMSPFFAGSINIRSLSPPYSGDIPGMFPDVTLGGLLPFAPEDVNINEDLNEDSIPDIFD